MCGITIPRLGAKTPDFDRSSCLANGADPHDDWWTDDEAKRNGCYRYERDCQYQDGAGNEDIERPFPSGKAGRSRLGDRL